MEYVYFSIFLIQFIIFAYFILKYAKKIKECDDLYAQLLTAHNDCQVFLDDQEVKTIFN
jgi:hypothetical protein